MNRELPDIQTGFRKGRGTRDQIANITWITEKVREFQKNIYFWFIDYAKAFNCVNNNKLWKILQRMGIPYHLTCLLRNLYAGQEATARILHGTTDWLKTGQGTTKLYIVTLLICRVHHVKCQGGWSTRWNQDCQEKYQQPQICRWYHPNGRKQRGTKEPVDESERGEWKSWLKNSAFKTLRSWHPAPSFQGKQMGKKL